MQNRVDRAVPICIYGHIIYNIISRYSRKGGNEYIVRCLCGLIGVFYTDDGLNKSIIAHCFR